MARVERMTPGWTMTQLEESEVDVGCGHSEADRFRVRMGPNYSRTGRKEPSLDFLYDLKTVDNFKFSKRIFPMAAFYNEFELDEHARNFKHPVVPPVLVCSVHLPAEGHSFFGGSESNVHVVAFFQIKPETIAALENLDEALPCYRNFVNWCEKAETDAKCRSRFKFIGQVRGDFAAAGLPGMLQGYNGKPVLITASGTFLREKSNKFIEMNINVNVFNFIARRYLNSLKDKVGGMDADFGVTIEGRNDAELPERMAFGMRFKNVPFFDCEELSADAYEWLVKQVDPQFVPHLTAKDD